MPLLRLLSCLVLLVSSPGWSTPSPADQHFLHGRYAAARAAYAREARRGTAAAWLGVARVALRTGDYAAAEAAARRVASRRGRLGLEGQTLLAEVLMTTGRVAAARRTLDAVVKARPQALRARLLRARLLRTLGQHAASRLACEAFIDDYNADRIDQKRAADLHYVAAASHLCGNFRDANDTYLAALRLEPHRHEANIELGFLYLEKYNSADAAKSFGEVLKTDPHHPDALLGMARVALAESFHAAEAEQHLRQALVTNPKHEGALVARGEIALADERYAEAAALAQQALKINPASLAATTLRGGAAFLTDNQPGFRAARAVALKVGPEAAHFFHGLAEMLARQHRYDEAIALELTALHHQPKNPSVRAALGQHYLRQGDDRQGLKHLKEAWRGDPYNARTYNLLDLFEGEIAKRYTFVEGRQFRLRVPARDREILKRYALPLLQRAARTMAARYGRLPVKRVQVELFDRPASYAVRTVGLPGLGALGVCFGRVITSRSPRGGHFNWGMVLWHELSHVFTIGLSRSRVPRWFTEGLAEVDAQQARPEWRRKRSSEVVAALEAGDLPSIARLNTAFTRSRSVGEIVVAYQQASLVVAFLRRRFGSPAIVRMLSLWRAGRPTAEVLLQTTRLTIPALDAAFRADLKARMPWYFGSYQVSYRRFRDLKRLQAAAQAQPGDARAQVHLGFALLARRQLDRATAQARKALTLQPRSGEAQLLLGEVAMAKKDAAVARRAYRAAIAAGLDGYDLRMRLGLAALKAGDLTAAARELKRAKRADPEQDEPYQLLAEAYRTRKRLAEELAELEGVVSRNPQALPPLRRLVEQHAAASRWAKVLQFAPLAVNLDPFDATIHVHYARALRHAGRRQQAIFELESALLCEPTKRAALEAELKALRGPRRPSTSP